jgi:glycosyltransferase involved in cell wall biosynthesis
MAIDLVFITYNRLGYTKLALRSVLADPAEEFSLTIWDNGSTDGTAEYLKNEVRDPRIVDTVFCPTNAGQMAAVNEVWGRSRSDLVGKLDNDCLVTPGWTRKLAQAHHDIQSLGAIACWHYPLDEFDEQAARRAGKIQSFGHHEILRHPWTCGTGLLLKRATYERFGTIRGGATTDYWLMLALAGYVNGFYYPLIPQEHMDDPRSPHSVVRDDESLRKMYDITYTLRVKEIRTMKSRWARRRVVLRNLNRGPWQAERYTGWRGKVRRLAERCELALQAVTS